MKADDPIIWIGAGVAIAIIGFLLLDSYSPVVGFMWNVMHGTIQDIPYRYILALAVGLALYGFYLWFKKSTGNST